MKIPYFDIQEKIAEIIQKSGKIGNASVDVEVSKEEIYEDRPSILIYLKRGPRTNKTIGGTKPRESKLEYIIEIAFMNVESIAEACRDRDDLVGEVEEILLKSTTRLKISDDVTPIIFIEITDTQFESAFAQFQKDDTDEDFLMVAIMTVEVTLRG